MKLPEAIAIGENILEKFKDDFSRDQVLALHTLIAFALATREAWANRLQVSRT